MPCVPTNSDVIEQLKLKIVSGIYKMGEEIVPQKFKRVEILNGKPVISEIVVSGRKQPLTDIREQMLEEHQKYFRIFSDADYSSMTREKLINELQRIEEYKNNDFNLGTAELKCTLKPLQRTRNLMLWHDTSTASDHSHLLMLVKCVYDTALFFTDDEYEQQYEEKKVCKQLWRNHSFTYLHVALQQMSKLNILKQG